MALHPLTTRAVVFLLTLRVRVIKCKYKTKRLLGASASATARFVFWKTEPLYLKQNNK